MEEQLLGNKQTLEGLIHSITHVPVAALRGTSLSTFTIDERLRWTTGRATTKVEDQVYCLLGIFGVFMPLIYGEGENAYLQLRAKIKQGAGKVAVMQEMNIIDMNRFHTIVYSHPLDRQSCAKPALHWARIHSTSAGLCHQ